ncbi:MAG: MBL fold metallo-hydrolase [Nocardioidaceae bacterium]
MGDSCDTDFVEVADRCFVARYPEWDVNVGVLLGSAGALVVDTRASATQGAALHDDVRRLAPGAEIRWVVNTHQHFDHTFGNGAFAGASVYAHENAAAGMPEAAARLKGLIKADRELDPDHPEITAEVLDDVLGTELRLPDRTFSSVATIDLGDRFVELLYPGRGHTDGDLVVRVPDCEVLFAGDLVEESPDRDATPGFGVDCFPLEWGATLDLAIGMVTDRYVVVPGHGAPVDREFMDRQRADISDVAEMIRTLAGNSVPVDEALRVGTETARPVPLAESYTMPPGAGPDAAAPERLGWPFDPVYLADALRRGYAQLGRSERTLPLA